MFLTQQSTELVDQSTVPDFQVILKSAEMTQSLRNLTANHVNKLLKVRKVACMSSILQNLFNEQKTTGN
jgi:DNA replicative helicase MCM subunit Mcm2 (Cdc46/Mcm family)